MKQDTKSTAAPKTDTLANGSSDNSGLQNKPQHENKEASQNDQENQQGESLLEKFFLDQLKDIYYAEQQIVKAIPKMEKAASTEELKEAFNDHLHQTQKHVKRLEKVFEKMDKKPEGKKCEAIDGILREADTIISETQEGTMTRDAALIIAAQKVEHYEIASYGGLVQLALTIRQDEAANLLDKTLGEEEDTDILLTEIAENHINIEAEEETKYTANRKKQYQEEE